MNFRVFIVSLIMILLIFNPSYAENDSPSYKSGYKKGLESGKDHAKGGCGMPYDIALNIMADGATKDTIADNYTDFKNGYIDGFRDGFKYIKPYKLNQKNYENLSWENAKNGVKLYDNMGKQQATIVSMDKKNGIIYVKYVKKGIVEPKRLDALSYFWYVKRK